MQIIDHYLLPPGACSICGNAHGRAIDTGKEIDEFFRVFICEQCVRHMAGMFGLVDEQQVKDAHEARDAAVAALAAESKKLDAAREAVRNMQAAGFAEEPQGVSGEVWPCDKCGFIAGSSRALSQHKRVHANQVEEAKV